MVHGPCWNCWTCGPPSMFTLRPPSSERVRRPRRLPIEPTRLTVPARGRLDVPIPSESSDVEGSIAKLTTRPRTTASVAAVRVDRNDGWAPSGSCERRVRVGKHAPMTAIAWVSLVLGSGALAVLVLSLLSGLWLLAAAMTLTVIAQVIAFASQRRKQAGVRT